MGQSGNKEGINKLHVYVKTLAVSLGYSNFGCYIVQTSQVSGLVKDLSHVIIPWVTYVSAMIGSFLVGFLITAKKRTLIIIGNCLALSIALMYFPIIFNKYSGELKDYSTSLYDTLSIFSIITTILSRLVQGFGISLLMIIVPLYLKESPPLQMIPSVLLFNFLHYYFALLVNTFFVVYIDDPVICVIPMFSFSIVLSVVQIILYAKRINNDTPLQLCKDNLEEESIQELARIYDDPEARMDEFLRIKELCNCGKLSTPSYRQLFGQKNLKETMVGLFTGLVWAINRLGLIKAVRLRDIGYIKGLPIFIVLLEMSGATVEFFLAKTLGRRTKIILGSIVSLILGIGLLIVCAGYLSDESFNGEESIALSAFLIMNVLLFFNFGLTTSTLSYLHMAYSLPSRGFALSMIFYFFIISVGDVLTLQLNVGNWLFFVIYYSVLLFISIGHITIYCKMVDHENFVEHNISILGEEHFKQYESIKDSCIKASIA